VDSAGSGATAVGEDFDSARAAEQLAVCIGAGEAGREYGGAAGEDVGEPAAVAGNAA